MKKTIALILLLALCLLALTACKADIDLGSIAQQLHEANAASDSDSDSADADNTLPEDISLPDNVPMPDAPEEVSASDVPDQAPDTSPNLPVETAADLTALTVEQCVADAEDAAGQLPRIVLDCAGAAAINGDIESMFRHLVDTDYCTLWYDAWKNDRVLSVLIAQKFDNDCVYYTPYNLDLSTGQRLSGQELMDLLGIERTAVGDTEIAVMAEEFEHMYGGLDEGDSAPFYQEQYERTVSPDNMELERLWLGFGGELYFVAKLYSMAGAEFYEYVMPTGFTF